MKLSKKSIKRAGNCLSVVSLCFIGYKLFAGIDDLPVLPTSLLSIVMTAACLLINCVMIVLSAYIWKNVLSFHGSRLDLKDAFIIMSKSQVAKYIPGNVFQLVSRITLSGEKSIPPSDVLSSLIHEAVIITTGSLLMASLSFVLFVKSTPLLTGYTEGWLLLLIITFFLCAAGVLSLLSKFHGYGALIWKYVAFLPFRHFASYVVLVCLSFLGFGISLKLLAGYVLDAPTDLNILHFSSGFAFAWLLGYLTPGSPGGVGIREAAMVILFEGKMDQPVVISLALIFRLVNVLSDLICFVLAISIEKMRPKSQ